jgi:asparagine synthase (glutamine-hydrolysing)
VVYALAHVRRLTQYLVVFTRSAIDVRCPYFDYDLIDLIYSLPPEIRGTPDLTRKVLTRRMPALAVIPNEADLRLPHERKWIRDAHSVIPRGASWLRRRGVPLRADRPRLYADYEQYLRTDLRPWGEALLFDGRTIERGLFNPAAVRELWARHQSGELWTIGKIAPLMAIEQVIRYLVEDESAETAAVPPSVG